VVSFAGGMLILEQLSLDFSRLHQKQPWLKLLLLLLHYRHHLQIRQVVFL
jgi:hypothetical protein